MVIAWAENVNDKILDSTQITIGEGGYVEDKSESGAFTERRLTSLAVPDVFEVIMDFNWEEKDKDGNSEFDRFVNWYKFTHRRGVNPFKFPSITKFNVNGSLTTCQYKITGPLKPTKSGFCMRVSMQWKEVYSGAINVKTPVLKIDHIEAENGTLYVYYNFTPVETPSIDNYKLSLTQNLEDSFLDAPLSDIVMDTRLAKMKFNKKSATGPWFARLNQSTEPNMNCVFRV